MAGITTRQRDRLAVAGVSRVTELGLLDPERRVAGIGESALGRVREQARLQVLGRGAPRPIYELLLDAEPGTGLERLPLPKPGDLFLDLEGDAFVHDQGLEYLFGLLELGEPSDDIFSSREKPGAPRYKGYWARDRAEEKRAFEAVIDRIVQGRSEFRDLHVFHFGHRRATRSSIFRVVITPVKTRSMSCSETMCSWICTVVRRSVRASVEGYTLSSSKAYTVRARTSSELRRTRCSGSGGYSKPARAAASERELTQIIERYNEEDCLSTWKLRDWLEARRADLERVSGRALARPALPADSKAERAPNEAGLVAASLLAALPEDPGEDTPEQAARRLMAALLDWHCAKPSPATGSASEPKKCPPTSGSTTEPYSQICASWLSFAPRRNRRSIVTSFPSRNTASGARPRRLIRIPANQRGRWSTSVRVTSI